MKKFFLMLFAASCFNATLQAQVAPVKNEGTTKDVVAKLQTLSTDKIIEKAYLQFDKPYYSPGDTIYFKAYVTAGEMHELSKISGVLHVDLVSKNDSVMQSVILQLKSGLAWGDFALPNYLSKGNYRVRAYTQWMQNAGDNYFFNKTIPINGNSIAQVYPAKVTNNKTDVQFFPEGGSFVAAIPGRIAFKAVSSNGMGVYVKGMVFDNNNVAVAKFTSSHLGMGQLFLTPEAGKTYKAKVTYPDGSVNIIDLPQPEAKGMALTVNNSDLNKLSIDINANKPYYLENKDKEISVVIYSAGVVKTVKTVLDNQSIGFDLPKKDLKTGITQVTLFSGAGVPLSERLVFIQNNDGVNFTVNSDKTVYTSHDKANVTLNAKIAGDKTSIGNYSVAVINENKVVANEDKESSILSDLLLTSDLRGYVEQPGYYFNNVNDDTRNNLDVLMLTQGYRRFQWKDLLNEPATPVAYRPEFGMQVKGTLLTKTGQPIADEKVSLMMSATGQTLTATTDAAGKFNFPDLQYADRTQFLLNVDNKSLRDKVKLVLDKTNVSLPLNANGVFEGKMDDKLPEYIASNVQNDAGTANALKPVYVNRKANYKTSSLAGAGNADQVIFNKQFRNHPSLSQGLTGIARGIQFVNGKAYSVLSNVVAPGGMKSEPMMTVVDGAITSMNMDNINPGDVESVEILKGANAAVYGLGAGSGVIVINTKKGGGSSEDVSMEMAPGILSFAPRGFYTAREFYSPVYYITQRSLPEERTTIYWKPNLTTDNAGNASFNYFNDGPGKYRVIIEGIDNAGNIGRAVYKYNVH
jgi:TonB-dependent SusC/RagA subfamily outer membrane receptor